MGLEVFLPERRFFHWKGRRFVCGKPTVATIFLLVARFPQEIYACARAAHAAPQLFAEDPIDACLPFFCRPGDRRAGEVLESCVEGGLPGELPELTAQDPALADGLAREVLTLCSPARIVEALELGRFMEQVEKSSAEPEPAEGPSVQLLGLCSCARAFSCSPREVLAWPFEAFLEVVADVLPLLLPGAEPQAVPGPLRARPGAPVATAAELADIGLEVVRARPRPRPVPSPGE